MFAFLTPILGFMGRNKLISGLLGVVLGLGVLWAAYAIGLSLGHSHQKADDAAADAKAVAAATQRDSAAKEQAAAERATDTAQVGQLQKELNDAYAQTPDDKPSSVRNALACARLRHAGQDVSKLPQCF